MRGLEVRLISTGLPNFLGHIITFGLLETANRHVNQAGER